MPDWTTDDIPDQRGKTIVVTGANSGIGWEAAKALAAKGAEVVLACRSVARGEGALARIREAHPDARVSLMTLDLASLASVRAFAEEFRKAHARLDVLVNNAGLMAIPRATTSDGFEMQLGTNHLGHFALTGALIGLLAASGSSASKARVVTVSSGFHRAGKMRFDDLMGEQGYGKWTAYCQSKLANLLFAYELNARVHAADANVISVAAHPGYAATELQAKGPTLDKSAVGAWMMKTGNALFAQTAAMGATPTLRAATDPRARGGDYFGPGGFLELMGPPVRVGRSDAAKDPAVAKQLWDESVRLTGVAYADLGAQ